MDPYEIKKILKHFAKKIKTYREKGKLFSANKKFLLFFH